MNMATMMKAIIATTPMPAFFALAAERVFLIGIVHGLLAAALCGSSRTSSSNSAAAVRIFSGGVMAS